MNGDILYQYESPAEVVGHCQPRHYALLDTDEGSGSSPHSSNALQVLWAEQVKAHLNEKRFSGCSSIS